MRFFEAKQFAQYVGNIVLDVSAIDHMLSGSKMLSAAVFQDRTMKIISALFDAAAISFKIDPNLIIISTLECVIGDRFLKSRLYGASNNSLQPTRPRPLCWPFDSTRRNLPE